MRTSTGPPYQGALTRVGVENSIGPRQALKTNPKPKKPWAKGPQPSTSSGTESPKPAISKPKNTKNLDPAHNSPQKKVPNPKTYTLNPEPQRKLARQTLKARSTDRGGKSQFGSQELCLKGLGLKASGLRVWSLRF